MRAAEFINELEIIDEMPLPTDWDEKVFKLNPKDKVKQWHSSKKTYPESSFEKYIKYAQQRAKELGEGSSRTVVNIKYNGKPSALKLAMNEKGLAQNAEELKFLSNPKIAQTGIVIPLIDHDKKNKPPVWLQTAYAKSIMNSQLCEFFGIFDMQVLTDAAEAYKYSKNKTKFFNNLKAEREKRNKDPETTKRFLEYLKGFVLLESIGINLVDFRWAQNWGIYKGKPVVLDLGYSYEVKKKHYS